MFDDVLIESGGIDRKRGGGLTALISAAIHVGMIGAVIAAGRYMTENPEIIQKPIAAFIVTSPAPPPPPPPPPAASNASTPVTKKPETPKERPELMQPRDTPRNVPVVSEVETKDHAAAGVVGGQKGGVAGGKIGGEVGGEVGGVMGGKVGGVTGGTGDSPLRVGGNVLAPVAVQRAEPQYTEVARKARVQGIVIVEAIIDREGNVVDARIMKGLPFGLDQEALRAIKRWKFRPGTQNGVPVPVYFNLRIEFKLN